MIAGTRSGSTSSCCRHSRSRGAHSPQDRQSRSDEAAHQRRQDVCEPRAEHASAERSHHLHDLDQRVADWRHAVEDLLDRCSVQHDRRDERAGSRRAQPSQLRGRAADENDAAGQALARLRCFQDIERGDGAIGPQIMAQGQQSQHAVAADRHRPSGNLEPAGIGRQQQRRSAAVVAHDLHRQRRPQSVADDGHQGHPAHLPIRIAGQEQHAKAGGGIRERAYRSDDALGMPEVVHRQSTANQHRGCRGPVVDPLGTEGDAKRRRRLLEGGCELLISVGQRVGQAGDVVLAGDLRQAAGQRRRRALVRAGDEGVEADRARLGVGDRSDQRGDLVATPWPLPLGGQRALVDIDNDDLRAGRRGKSASIRSKLRSRRCSAKSERPASSMRMPIRIASQVEIVAIAQRLSLAARESNPLISRGWDMVETCSEWLRPQPMSRNSSDCHNGILIMVAKSACRLQLKRARRCIRARHPDRV